MTSNRFYTFLHRQIPIIILLSLLPGLGYLFLGWLNHIFIPAFVWYLLVVIESAWGYRLYRTFDSDTMSENQRESWYRQLTWFFYIFMLLWVLIFLLYVRHDSQKLHYIAIFTEIGASVVAASLLASDRRLFKPSILILMIPLISYFLLIGASYAYVLSAFACTLTWVLLYTANSTNHLLMQADYQATHDMLTGMYNRHFFIDHLQKRMNSLRDNAGFTYLLLLDLDHFKNINDSLGHDIGDLLLQQMTLRLEQQLPKDTVAARLGGDEFIVVGGTFEDREICSQTAIQLSKRLISNLKEAYLIEQHHLYISASIGVSVVSRRCDNANCFIKEADIAMYEVKANGRNGVFLFNDEMSDRVEKNIEIESLLHFALPNHEITLHYQPQVDSTGKVIGAEVLARWNNHKIGSVPPDKFIDVAEQTGLIIELGNHILETAFQTLQEWCDAGIELQQFAINISMRQLTHHTFVEQVEALLRHYHSGKMCGKIVFEITESVLAEDISRVVAVMHRLKECGIRFSMDDFGTGYSSLNYLNRLPIDEIKIDRTFVGAIEQNEQNQAMVVTILKMAKIFKLRVVAEGVETAEQRDFLFSHGCNMFQGFYFSRSLPKEQFVAFYRNQHS
ncbi:MAG: EAL domain-containing protein [Desulfuromonadaceae bacterium]|nr:EAL domain-containing protein [Desulfuromonadaceae bacterium]MDD2848221.1 EAL domain-containing protein [Desulfuromonadaceae bacterium]MDD4130612.1 EAL domain-containing protein [Desulfuromonadaceae bacterium]